MTKPLRVWLSPVGPLAWKVVGILEELAVPYGIKALTFEDVKKPPVTDMNPNGGLPIVEDPNTDMVVWETGAILPYLISQYDKDHRLHYSTLKEQTLCSQWLMFQVTSQEPYFGQCTFFRYLHPEKVPSAIGRFTTEVRRILSVLDTQLGKNPAGWLVGDRMTYVDLAFAGWNDQLDTTLGVPSENKFDGFPHVKGWHERMTQRDSWKKAMETRKELMAEQGIDWDGLLRSKLESQAAYGSLPSVD